MSLPQPNIPFGPDDYLAWERDQPCRNEYVDGEVLAMSGASDAHGTAAGNLFAGLHASLRGTPCRPFIADMKVRVEAANGFFYPDILVTCDPRDRRPEASHVKFEQRRIEIFPHAGAAQAAIGRTQPRPRLPTGFRTPPECRRRSRAGGRSPG